MGFHGDARRKQRLVTGTSVNMRLVEKAGAAVDEFFRKSTEGKKGGGTLNIIASVREPVACYLSGYYQILGGTGFKKLSHEDVVRDVEGLIRSTKPVNQMLWWNREIKGRFGIDVLAMPFDKQRGWKIYESGRIRLLVVRQENFDALGDALGALFGVDSDKIRLFKRNTAAGKKKLAADYARKINDCALDGELLDQVYDNSWFQTFYTPEEEAVFREKWGGGASVSG